MQKDYGIAPGEWSTLWDFWRMNAIPHPDWTRNFSREKLNKLTSSRRWREKKIKVISISKLIFISDNTFLIEIQQFCPGLCSINHLYFIEFDKSTFRCTVKHKLETGVS
jgi:archaellum biogenesis ATPase FlaH